MLKHRCVDSITQINKASRKAKKASSQVTVLNLGKLDVCKSIAYSDASVANLSNRGSQGDYIIHLVSKNGMSVPISWQLKRIKRVMKNTQAAKTLPLVDNVEVCEVYYRNILIDLLGLKDYNWLPIYCRTDNAVLHDSVHSSTQIMGKWL